MEIARAVLLTAAGSAAPTWSNAATMPKALMPIANEPVIAHTLLALRDAGILEVVLVTPPASAHAFRAAVGDGSRWNLTLHHAVEAGHGQDLGETLRALWPRICDEPVLVQPAGGLVRGGLSEHTTRFAASGLDALLLSLASPIASGVPKGPSWLLLGADAARAVAGQLGPFEPEAALARHHLQCETVDGCLACHGGEDSLLQANRHVLEGILTSTAGAHLEDCELQGPVVVHPTAWLRRTLVRGPAVIGPRARLSDAYVGPYTSVGADTVIEGTELEHSIVMDNATLMHVGTRLETSVIGRGASITRRFAMPSAARLLIGDGAEVVWG